MNMNNNNFRKFCIWCNISYKSPQNYKLHLQTQKHKINAQKKFDNYKEIIDEADNDIKNFINKFNNVNLHNDLNYETALLFAYANDDNLNFSNNYY